MSDFDKSVDEMYGIVDESGADMFAAEGIDGVTFNGIGKKCEWCGNYFAIDEDEDDDQSWRWICPDCKRNYRKRYAKIVDDEGS